MKLRMMLLLAAPALWGQTFELATIKPNASISGNSGMQWSGTQIRLENYSLAQLVKAAYKVQDFAFSGPSWLDDYRFDVVGKAPGRGVSKSADFEPMLQNLLAERFKVAVHRESKSVAGYVLLVDKKGAKVHPAEPNMGSSSGRGMLRASGASMADLARMLAMTLSRPVSDLTEMPGTYAFDLKWATEEGTADAALPNSIFTALQEQAGLRLEGRKVPVEVLVVDRMEKTPMDN